MSYGLMTDLGLMPDHLHAILHVTRPMKESINVVVRSFWQGAKKLGRAYSASFSCPSLSIIPASYAVLFIKKHFS